MKTFTDQIGNTIELSGPTKRIVSLVPSQSELLFDLGLNEELVGVTKFCIHPKQLKGTRTIVGGTKTLHFERIRELNPDLIIANKEENEEGLIKELISEYQVWTSDIHNLDDSFEMITELGKMTGRSDKANELVSEIKTAFGTLKPGRFDKNLTAAYFIWREPFMTAGGHSFISHMLELCGIENIFADSKADYPEFKLEELGPHSPDLILLSSEPFPFAEKHISEFENIFPSSKILLVDGELFSWYGSRLCKSPEYFRQLFTDI